jgi:hypothetical protein
MRLRASWSMRATTSTEGGASMVVDPVEELIVKDRGRRGPAAAAAIPAAAAVAAAPAAAAAPIAAAPADLNPPPTPSALPPP